MIELPDLPQGYLKAAPPWDYKGEMFTEGQMRRYGVLCSEQAAKVCDDLATAYQDLSKHQLLTTSGKTVHQGMYGGAVNCASAIRNMIGEIK